MVICPMLVLFRKYGPQYGFDPLMLAAQGYQESTLDQNAKSHVGAIGIMQVMPATGKELKVGDITKIEVLADGAVVAVDLNARSLLWAHTYATIDRPDAGMTNPGMGRPFPVLVAAAVLAACGPSGRGEGPGEATKNMVTFDELSVLVDGLPRGKRKFVTHLTAPVPVYDPVAQAPMQPFACVEAGGSVDGRIVYMPLHGFTAVDLGYQPGNAVLRGLPVALSLRNEPGARLNSIL